MKHTSLRNLRHFAGEHLTWLSLCGLVAVITGFTPEEWVAHFAEELRVSGVVDGHWPTYLDIRAVLVAVGVGVIVTDVLLKRRAASPPLRTAETTATNLATATAAGSVTPRSRADNQLGADHGKLLIRKRGYYETNMNPKGLGISHQYVHAYSTTLGDDLVQDRTTGLVWQRSGSLQTATYAEAQRYVQDLRAKASGAADWRLPTLDEAMSLMEARLQTNDLHIDALFDKTQATIWTCDGSTSGGIWVVNYEFGSCEILPTTSYYRFWARAVRSGE